MSENDEKKEQECECGKYGFPAKYTVSRQYKGGTLEAGEWFDGDPSKEHETEDVIEVVAFPQGVYPAHVSATMGLTINLGDYESAKISVTTTLPCFKEELDDAFESAKNYSGQKMLAEKQFIEDTIAKKKRGK